jgi:hypothetical protein
MLDRSDAIVGVLAFLVGPAIVSATLAVDSLPANAVVFLPVGVVDGVVGWLARVSGIGKR